MSSTTSDGTDRRLITPLFLLVMLATFAYFFGVGIIMPTLPRFVEGPLDGGSGSVGWTIGAFAISAVLLRPFVGRLSDRRGRRILVVGGGMIVGISMLGYAVADSIVSLTLFRLLTGVGEAGFYTGAASVVNDIVPDERRGEGVSYFSLALFSGMAIGPVAGELILEATRFDLVWVAAAAASFVAGFLGFPIPETRPPRADEVSTKIINRGALLPGAVLGTNIWALAAFVSFVPLYALQIGMTGSRFVFALQSGLVFAVRLFGARLPDRLGPIRTSRLSLIGVIVGFLVIAAWPEPTGLFLGTVVYSLGHAVAFPGLMTLAVRSSPESERGSAVATFTASFDLFFGVGAMSAGAVASFVGYRGAFVGAAVVGAGLLLLTQAARQQPDHGRLPPVPQEAVPAEAGRH